MLRAGSRDVHLFLLAPRFGRRRQGAGARCSLQETPTSHDFVLCRCAMASLTLFEKLDQIESRYQELTAQRSSHEVLGDSSHCQKLPRSDGTPPSAGGYIA